MADRTPVPARACSLIAPLAVGMAFGFRQWFTHRLRPDLPGNALPHLHARPGHRGGGVDVSTATPEQAAAPVEHSSHLGGIGLDVLQVAMDQDWFLRLFTALIAVITLGPPTSALTAAVATLISAPAQPSVAVNAVITGSLMPQSIVWAAFFFHHALNRAPTSSTISLAFPARMG